MGGWKNQFNSQSDLGAECCIHWDIEQLYGGPGTWGCDLQEASGGMKSHENTSSQLRATWKILQFRVLQKTISLVSLTEKAVGNRKNTGLGIELLSSSLSSTT